MIGFLYIAIGLWFVQQVNDIANAWINREHVPKLFFLSAGCSLLSGLALFGYLFSFHTATVGIVNTIIGILNS